MKLLQMKKRIMSGVLAISMVSGGTAWAADKNAQPESKFLPSESRAVSLEVKELDAVKGVNILVDGLPFTPTDAGGNEVFPFITNGTTYLPVRALATVYGIDIDWNDKEKAVLLSVPDQVQVHNNSAYRESTPLTDAKLTAVTGARVFVNGKEVVLTGSNGNPVDVYLINGTTYLPVRAISDLLNVGIIWNSVQKEDGTYFDVYIGKIYHNVRQEYNDMMMKAINQAEQLAPYLGPVNTASNRVAPLCSYAIELRGRIGIEWLSEVDSPELEASYEKLCDYIQDVIIPLNSLSLDVATQNYAEIIKGMFLSYPADISNERMESSLASIEYASVCMQTTEDHYEELIEKITDEEIRKHYEMVDRLYQEALTIYQSLVPDKTIEY